MLVVVYLSQKWDIIVYLKVVIADWYWLVDKVPAILMKVSLDVKIILLVQIIIVEELVKHFNEE